MDSFRSSLSQARGFVGPSVVALTGTRIKRSIQGCAKMPLTAAGREGDAIDRRAAPPVAALQASNGIE